MADIVVTDWLFLGISILLYYIGLCGCFVKSGKPGWWAFIPIVNWVLMLQTLCIKKRHIFWLLLFAMPLIGMIPVFWWNMCMMRACGYRKGYFFLLFRAPPLAMLIAGFGKHEYDYAGMLMMKQRITYMWKDVFHGFLFWEVAKRPTWFRYWFMKQNQQ